MEDERRVSTPTRKVGPKMAAALANADDRTQLLLGLKLWRMITLELKLWKLMMMTTLVFSGYTRKRHSKGTKRKTRKAKGLEDARKALA